MGITSIRLEFLRKYFVLLALLVFQSYLNQVVSLNAPVWVEPPNELKHRSDPGLVKILAFGHFTTVIDWKWVQALAESAWDGGVHHGKSQFYNDLDLITEIDPAFFEVYLAGGNYLAVVRNEPEASIALLTKGDQWAKNELNQYSTTFQHYYWNQRWAIPLVLAYVYVFELNDLKKAAVAFTEAAQIPGSPGYLKNLERSFTQPGGEYDVGAKLLTFMMQQAKDDLSREKLAEKLQSLKVGRFLKLSNLKFEEYLHSKSRLPTQLVWFQFLKDHHFLNQDPWGGTLQLNQKGRIISSTPHDPIFGLE